MHKTILITGATDGIGLATARALVAQGHHVLLHGRNQIKLASVADELARGGGQVGRYLADLSRLAEVEEFAEEVAAAHPRLDVLVNNAGVYETDDPLTPEGLDVRFVVNTIAPYLLMQRLLPALDPAGRVVNLSSAAQAPVDLQALSGQVRLDAGAAYAQSKLAITMWSNHEAARLTGGPACIPVNPGSLLATNMVHAAFGIAGSDVGKGADVLCRAALADEFAQASGRYFDNDSGRFAPPHPDALDAAQCAQLVEVMDTLLARALS